MLYKVLSLNHEEENALFFSVQRPSRRLSFIHSFFICHIYKILQFKVGIMRLKKK